MNLHWYQLGKILDIGNKCNKNDITFLEELTIQELTKIKGIGRVKAIQIKAVCELAKRIGKPIYKDKIIIKGSEDIAEIFMQELRNEKREVAKLVILNNKNVIIKIKDISFGGQNFVLAVGENVAQALGLGLTSCSARRLSMLEFISIYPLRAAALCLARAVDACEDKKKLALV